MEPRFAPAQNTLGLAYAQLGMVEEAIVELDNARVCAENHPAAVAALAHALATTGNRHKAHDWLGDLKRTSSTRRVSAYWFGIVHTGLGEYDLALDALERAYGEHSQWLEWLKVDPRFEPLRKHARFDDILQKIRLLESAVRSISCGAP